LRVSVLGRTARAVNWTAVGGRDTDELRDHGRKVNILDFA
jgi:hypothetical protein